MAAERGFDVAARRIDAEVLRAGIFDQGFDQPRRDTPSADLGRDQRMRGDADMAVLGPGQTADVVGARDCGTILAVAAPVVAGDRYVHRSFLAA